MRIGLICALAVWLAPCHLRAGDFIDSPMYHNPDLPPPQVEIVIPESFRTLWLRALERPEEDFRAGAAEAIARAHRRGAKGMEAAVGPLTAALEREGQMPSVRIAAARALVTLNARDAAAALLRAGQAGPRAMRELVDPVLARWDHRPAREAWLERLRDPAASVRSRVTAAECLGAVQERSAADPLRELVRADRAAPPLRLAAARALGTLQTEGLEEDAQRFSSDASPAGMPARLAAASLLRRHEGDTAVALLKRLTRDPEPAVGAVALARLIEIDPKHAVPDLAFLLASPDAGLRALAVEVLFRLPSATHLPRLGDRMDDVEPGVREAARGRLETLGAQEQWRTAVIAEGTRLLAAPGWRGQEQAAVLLARLDHKAAAARFVELLPATRPEVLVTAAWGLRKLAVPETLPAALTYVGEELDLWVKTTPRRGRKDVNPDWVDHQLSQLNQFIGAQKYADADATLRKFIPKREGRPEARAAAIWALGLLHEGKFDPALAKAAEARLNDFSIPPEDARVRRMSAVLLGRLDAKAALPSLQKYFVAGEASENLVNNATGWAIERLTGKKYTTQKPLRQTPRDWFLSPLD